MSTLIQTRSTHSLQWQDYTLELYTSINDIAGLWEGMEAGQDIFLSVPYLRAMELAPPRNMSYYYVTVADENGLCGIIYCQLDHFNAKRSLNYERNGNGDSKSGLREVLRDFVARKIDFYTLVVGNSTVTGSHGFIFHERVGDEECLSLVDSTASWVKDIARDDGYDVQLIFVKDFYHPAFTHFDDCTAFPQYNEFKAQPGMELRIRDRWLKFEDYLSDLHSKYRVRIRRARKKLSGISVRELTEEEIVKYEGEIYHFYRAIADKSVFNLFLLHPNYFSTLRKELGDKFHVCGYFEGGSLVAFSTVIENGGCMDAHFLGYEGDKNREKQLYLNMLVDIIEFAIQRQFQAIFFARTALEIKSSVGAQPRDMYFYLRHMSGLQNKLLPKIYGILDPKEEWIARSPFKE